jgi:hypothetical protein
VSARPPTRLLKRASRLGCLDHVRQMVEDVLEEEAMWRALNSTPAEREAYGAKLEAEGR